MLYIFRASIFLVHHLFVSDITYMIVHLLVHLFIFFPPAHLRKAGGRRPFLSINRVLFFREIIFYLFHQFLSSIVVHLLLFFDLFISFLFSSLPIFASSVHGTFIFIKIFYTFCPFTFPTCYAVQVDPRSFSYMVLPLLRL